MGIVRDGDTPIWHGSGLRQVCWITTAKRVSRYNNLEYGLSSLMVCFPGEDKQKYEAIRAEYYQTFQPANVVERGLIDDLVSASFEQLRWFDLPPACLAGTAL